jgi:hypothetical protein
MYLSHKIVAMLGVCASAWCCYVARTFCLTCDGCEQGIQEYNGGAVLGMAGKNCVAVACDMRYGAQMQTMAIDKNKIFKMHDR